MHHAIAPARGHAPKLPLVGLGAAWPIEAAINGASGSQHANAACHCRTLSDSGSPQQHKMTRFCLGANLGVTLGCRAAARGCGPLPPVLQGTQFVAQHNMADNISACPDPAHGQLMSQHAAQHAATRARGHCCMQLMDTGPAC
eukprot:jgi/Ulvmu1/12109/UM084_0034.1